MKVLVCGGRDFGRIKDINDRDDCLRAMKEEMFFNVWLRSNVLMPNEGDVTVIAGEANGADTLARKWAEYWELQYEGFPAEWELYGHKAGPLRNEKMLLEGPDLVVAFPGGRGTADMVKRARKVGIEVIEVEYNA